MSSISSVSTAPTRYPFFEDTTPSSEVRFSSNDLEEIYDLFVKKEIFEGSFYILEALPQEDLIIEKFNKNPELSIRHFTVHQRFQSSLTSDEDTFCHLACRIGAEKVLDWIFERFPNQKQFKLNTKPIPFAYLYKGPNFSNGPKTRARILAKMTKTAFDIRKKCIDSSHEDTNQIGRRFLTKPEIDTLLATNPQALLTDRVWCLGEDATDNMLDVITSAIKEDVFEFMPETHTKKQVMTEISNYSQIPFAVTSIIHDYVPFFLTQKGRDFLTLTIEIPKSRYIEKTSHMERLERDIQLTDTTSKSRLLINPFKMVLRKMMSNLNTIEQFIKTTKLLLNYDEDLPELSIRMELEHLLPTDFINRIKKSHENSLGLLARELEDFYKDNPMKAKEAEYMFLLEKQAMDGSDVPRLPHPVYFPCATQG